MFTQDSWPAGCGFRYDARRRRWERGDYHLRRDGPRHWRLFRGEADLTGAVIRTDCRKPDAVADELARKLRELTEAR